MLIIRDLREDIDVSIDVIYFLKEEVASFQTVAARREGCVMWRSNEAKLESFWEAKEVVFCWCEQNIFFPNWGGLVNKLYYDSSFNKYTKGCKNTPLEVIYLFFAQ